VGQFAYSLVIHQNYRLEIEVASISLKININMTSDEFPPNGAGGYFEGSENLMVKVKQTRTITRADLAEVVYQRVGLSRTESAELVEVVLSEISDTLVQGENVKLSSFGSFLVRSKSERIGRNPKTGVEVPITPRRVMVFKPSNIMKSRVNGEIVADEAE